MYDCFGAQRATAACGRSPPNEFVNDLPVPDPLRTVGETKSGRCNDTDSALRLRMLLESDGLEAWPK
jgi:hypothetical protein